MLVSRFLFIIQPATHTHTQWRNTRQTGNCSSFVYFSLSFFKSKISARLRSFFSFSYRKWKQKIASYKHLKMTNSKKNTNKKRNERKKERNAVQISKERGLILPLDSSVCLPQTGQWNTAVNKLSKLTLSVWIHTLDWQESITAAGDRKAQQKDFFLKWSSLRCCWVSWPLGPWNLLKCQVNGCQTKNFPPSVLKNGFLCSGFCPVTEININRGAAKIWESGYLQKRQEAKQTK